MSDWQNWSIKNGDFVSEEINLHHIKSKIIFIPKKWLFIYLSYSVFTLILLTIIMDLITKI